MAKFRKKVVVEAFQLTSETRRSNVDWPNWAHKAWNKEPTEVGALLSNGTPDGPLYVFTIRGNMQINFGDWIIQDIAGELYSCKPDIFEAAYESIEKGI